jgi:hypothetical protein
MTSRERWIDALLMAVVAVAFLVAFRNAVPGTVFSYDESDYMTAARAGFWSNYTEPHTLSLLGFIDVGLKAMHGEIGRTGLSDYIRDRHDLAFYRHYHGPLYSYWLSMANSIAGSSEYGVRLSGFAFHLLTFITIVAGVPWAFGREYRLAGWLGGVLYLFSLTNILTATELSSHVAFMWVCLLGLILIARFTNYPTRGSYYLALAGCTLSLAALEYGLLLFASLALALFVHRHRIPVLWPKLSRMVLASLGIVAAVLTVIWPVGVLKGSIIEGYLFIGYLAKYRKGSFGTRTPLEIWARRFQYDTADCVVMVVCLTLAALFLWRSRHRYALLAVLLYPVLMLLTTLKNTGEYARYFSSIPAPLIVVGSVLALERLREVPARVMAAGVAALGVVLALLAWGPARAGASGSDALFTQLLGACRSQPGRKILVPALYRPGLSYYLPDRTVLSFPPNVEPAVLADQIALTHPDMVCVYGASALPGGVVLRLATAEGELACAVR